MVWSSLYPDGDVLISYRLPRKVTSQLASSHKCRDKSRLPGGIRRSPPLQFASEMLPHPHRGAAWRRGVHCAQAYEPGCHFSSRRLNPNWVANWKNGEVVLEIPGAVGYTQQLGAPDDLWTLSGWVNTKGTVPSEQMASRTKGAGPPLFTCIKSTCT